MVLKNTGALHTQDYPVQNILIDDASMFASIYPRPEITFAHHEGKTMKIDQVTIKNPLVLKSGAFPMGEGLIFLADNFKAFQ